MVARIYFKTAQKKKDYVSAMNNGSLVSVCLLTCIFKAQSWKWDRGKGGRDLEGGNQNG